MCQEPKTALSERDSLTIDGMTQNRVAGPRTDAELAELLAGADQAIFPIGGGTWLEQGCAPTQKGIAFDICHLSNVVDYPSEDMTITVGAGIRIGHLQRILAEKGQTLPIDARDHERATLGGLIATNASGPRRLGYGSLRDYVLGIDIIDANGIRIHGGGRVVKNVAGYDLMKLHTGAFGTLGVIIQASLKLKPLPQARAMLIAGVAEARLEPVLRGINVSRTRPVGLLVLNRPGQELLAPMAGMEDDFALVALFEEHVDAVAWQVEQGKRELAELGCRNIHAAPNDAYATTVDQLTRGFVRQPPTVEVKATTVASKIAAVMRSASRTPGAVAIGQAGVGIVHVGLQTTTLEQTTALVRELEKSASGPDGAGAVTIPRCPTLWKASLPIWGHPAAQWRLMRLLKQKLDPRNKLNPGRFGPANP